VGDEVKGVVISGKKEGGRFTSDVYGTDDRTSAVTLHTPSQRIQRWMHGCVAREDSV